MNPLVYVTEGLRAALTPSVPHMRIAVILAAMLAALAVLTWLGVRGFTRRVIT